MTKFDEQLKLAVVTRYLSGTIGTRPLADEYGVSRSTIRQWIVWYQQHGFEGLRKKSGTYDAQFKLSVLRHMWNENLTYQQVAAEYNVRRPGNVAIWERLYHSGGIDALEPRPRGRTKKMPTPCSPQPIPAPVPSPVIQNTLTRDELVEENKYLRAEVAYLKKLDALLLAKKQAAREKKR
jgi:transposase